MSARGAPAGPRTSGVYALLALGVILVTCAELCLKKGAAGPEAGSVVGQGLRSLHSGWIWAGIAAYVLNFIVWLRILRDLPLVRAFNLMSAVYILVPLASWALLGERIGLSRAAGICLILVGVLLVARPMARLEEKL